MWPLLQRLQGGVVLLLLGLATLVSVFYRGRAVGKAVERREHDVQVSEQAAVARKEVRDGQLETARMDDDAIANELKREWLRGAAGKGGR